jgi:hypothetical protein
MNIKDAIPRITLMMMMMWWHPPKESQSILVTALMWSNDSLFISLPLFPFERTQLQTSGVRKKSSSNACAFSTHKRGKLSHGYTFFTSTLLHHRSHDVKQTYYTRFLLSYDNDDAPRGNGNEE